MARSILFFYEYHVTGFCFVAQDGGSCMVVPNVTATEAATLFPDMVTHDVPSGKGYLRTTPQPK